MPSHSSGTSRPYGSCDPSSAQRLLDHKIAVREGGREEWDEEDTDYNQKTGAFRDAQRSYYERTIARWLSDYQTNP